jgi:hypothetical protein
VNVVIVMTPADWDTVSHASERVLGVYASRHLAAEAVRREVLARAGELDWDADDERDEWAADEAARFAVFEMPLTADADPPGRADATAAACAGIATGALVALRGRLRDRLDALGRLVHASEAMLRCLPVEERDLWDEVTNTIARAKAV